MQKFARWLCAALEVIEKAGSLETIGGREQYDIRDWWERHRLADAKRRTEEAIESEGKALASAAIKKLTPAERRALGL